MMNHRLTLLCFDGDTPIGYGHLDREYGTMWLGICVAEGHTGKGVGSAIMTQLLASADEHQWALCLGVDVDTFGASRLYWRFGFVENHRTQKTIFMQRKRENQMADTIGSLVDKLATTNTKLFINQEFLHIIRRMETFTEFQKKCLCSVEMQQELFASLQKVVDLNIQRTSLVNEVDAKIIALIRDGVAGKELDDGANLQRAHKTYADADAAK